MIDRRRGRTGAVGTIAPDRSRPRSRWIPIAGDRPGGAGTVGDRCGRTGRREAEIGLRVGRRASRGVVQAGRIEDGTLTLSGTIDRAEQAALIEAEARRLLEAGAVEGQVPGGVAPRSWSSSRSGAACCRSSAATSRRRAPIRRAGRGCLQQTRIDDLYFDARGRLRVVGLCINQAAYLAPKSDAAKPDNNPRSQIGPAVLERLKGYPLPQGVAPKVIAHILADRVAFEENPVRQAPAVGERRQARRGPLPRRPLRRRGGADDRRPARRRVAARRGRGPAHPAGIRPDVPAARRSTAREASRRGRQHDGRSPGGRSCSRASRSGSPATRTGARRGPHCDTAGWTAPGSPIRGRGA